MNVTVNVNFNILVYSGPWQQLLKTRTPHRSVHDMNSAIQHEMEFHIDPASRMLGEFVDSYENLTYSSEGECKAACDELKLGINAQFRSWMRITQSIEEGGGDPRRFR